MSQAEIEATKTHVETLLRRLAQAQGLEIERIQWRDPDIGRDLYNAAIVVKSKTASHTGTLEFNAEELEDRLGANLQRKADDFLATVSKQKR